MTNHDLARTASTMGTWDTDEAVRKSSMSTTFLPKYVPTDASAEEAKAQGTRKPLRRLKLESIFSAMTLMHLLVLGALWTGTRPIDWIVCAALYVVRMFGVTAGYHRYFSHRSYKMGRVGQFLMAFLAQTSAQKGVLWWAAHHRSHHKHSDTELDTHSPKYGGLFYSHLGWLYDETSETDMSRVKDLARYPELVWLNRHWWVPPAALGVAVFLTLGWSGLFIGFLLSTVLLWHGTFFINSLSHLWGYQDYDSGDTSRNNFLLALITLGEGWHNNHHHYQSSTRQGFRWWQIDVTYYVLKVLSWTGVVWGLREPPASVVEGTLAKASRDAAARGSDHEKAPLAATMPASAAAKAAAAAAAVAATATASLSGTSL